LVKPQELPVVYFPENKSVSFVSLSNQVFYDLVLSKRAINSIGTGPVYELVKNIEKKKSYDNSTYPTYLLDEEDNFIISLLSEKKPPSKFKFFSCDHLYFFSDIVDIIVDYFN